MSGMRKLVCVAVAAIFGTLLSVNAYACNSESDYQISKVEAAKSQVVVTKGEKSVTFTVGQQTAVTINGKKASLAELQPGDKVAIDYESNTDVLAIKATREG